MSYKVMLFDLDGTLTDPKVGILKSLQYAFEKLGEAVPDSEVLEKFIGPPLQESFQQVCGFDAVKSQQALEAYREYFSDRGLYENEVYPGIPHLLQQLQASEIRLVVATSKPTVYAEKILRHFGLVELFVKVVGSNLDGTRTAKGEIIAYIRETFPDVRTEDFVMVGDRKHDLIGANANAIASIGVTYGYGSYEELADAGATQIVRSVEELADCLLPNKAMKV